MRMFIGILVMLMYWSCAVTKNLPGKEPFILHVWIYYQVETSEIQRVIDSSRCVYRLTTERQSDGVTEVSFSFASEPSVKKKGQMFLRIARFAGARGYATTRGRAEPK